MENLNTVGGKDPAAQEQAMWISVGQSSNAEETVGANALRQVYMITDYQEKQHGGVHE